MSKIYLQIKTFQQLSLDQLYELLQLRVDVFVVEQDCPYRELDGLDRDSETRHLLYYSTEKEQQNKLIAYVRILAPGSKKQVTVGRVIVAKPFRGIGLGYRLLKDCLKEAKHFWPNTTIVVNAQEKLQAYYAKNEFKAISETKIEDGIPHIMMEYLEGK